MEINDLLKNPEQIKSLITLLQTLVDAQGVTQQLEQDEPAPKKRRKNKIAGTKANASSKRENKFLDMPERNLHKEDTEIDKKLHKLPPTPRSRKFQQIRAVCRVCGKTEHVNPGYVTRELDRYKCNKCAGVSG